MKWRASFSGMNVKQQDPLKSLEGRRIHGPIRTPRVAGAGGQDRIMQEAANLARMVAAQTPLAGGENPDVSTTDFSAITPRAPIAATPNPLAAALTPGRGGQTPAVGASPFVGGSRAIAGVGMTPSVAGTPLRHPGATPARGAQGFGATPMRTPIRDELGLNDPDFLAKQVCILPSALPSPHSSSWRQLKPHTYTGLGQLLDECTWKAGLFTGARCPGLVVLPFFAWIVGSGAVSAI